MRKLFAFTLLFSLALLAFSRQGEVVPGAATPQAPQQYFIYLPVMGNTLAEPKVTQIISGSVWLNGGICCVGGTVGSTATIVAVFEATSPFTTVTGLRLITHSSNPQGQCVAEANLGEWQPYHSSQVFTTTIASGWTSFAVHVQFRDALGNPSPVVCDEIAVEGMPASETPTATLTPTTPTATATICPLPTQVWLAVEPVTSPTDLLTQTIIVRMDNGVAATITTESGTFNYWGEFGFGLPAPITITLLPNHEHHLEVSARVKRVEYAGCVYGDYTVGTTHDRHGQPLTIVQGAVTPSATPTPTATPCLACASATPSPTPTPTSTACLECASATPSPTPTPTCACLPTHTPGPGLALKGDVRWQGTGLAGVSIYRSYAAYAGVIVATTDATGHYQSEFAYIPGDEMVTVWAELPGSPYAFDPAVVYWRHYFGTEIKTIDFTVSLATPVPTRTPCQLGCPSVTPTPEATLTPTPSALPSTLR